MLNTSSNATENDINQLTDVYVLDVENNLSDTNNDDYVFYSEDSLVGSINGSISNNHPTPKLLKGILKQDVNMYNFLDNNNTQVKNLYYSIYF
jgi:hypothetical protein